MLYINNLGDKNDDPIAYNLTNEIIGDLEYIDTIRASNFNDIIQFKDSELQNTDIARKLEVEVVDSEIVGLVPKEAISEGTIQRLRLKSFSSNKILEP